MRIFLEETEWYPVPSPRRTRRKDHGAEVPDDVVNELAVAERNFWRAAEKLRRVYNRNWRREHE